MVNITRYDCDKAAYHVLLVVDFDPWNLTQIAML